MRYGLWIIVTACYKLNVPCLKYREITIDDTQQMYTIYSYIAASFIFFLQHELDVVLTFLPMLVIAFLFMILLNLVMTSSIYYLI